MLIPVRPWLFSVLAATVSALILSALAGPFGFSVMLVGTGLLAAAALITGAVASAGLLAFRRRPLSTAGLVVLSVTAWLMSLMLAAVCGAILARLPAGMQSDTSPLLTWTMLLAPFAVIGAGTAAISLLSRRRGRAKPDA